VNDAVGISLDSLHVLRSMLLDEPPLRQVEAEDSRRLHTIRAADTEGHRSSAHILVNRMYASRGYLNSPRVEQIRNPNRVTLIPSDHELTVGTISIGFDGPVAHHAVAFRCEVPTSHRPAKGCEPRRCA